MFPKAHKSKGFSMIEALLGIFLFVTSFVALYGVLISSFATVAQNKARLGAMSLANEQIEYMRSLPFSSVGVVSGNPSGTLPQVESGATVLLNGIQYTRRNVVFWVDDPADGFGINDENLVMTDYKQVKVDVSWNFRGITNHFFATTNIAPKGMETNVPGGTFKFTIFSVDGPVQGANIHIYKAGNPLPVIDVNRITNSDGVWYENGLPPGINYEITVTKAGYNTAMTYGITAGLPNPDPGHFTSIDDSVNPISFEINKVSNLNLNFFNTPADGTWGDTFSDETKISTHSSMETSGGNLVLTNTAGVYDTSGTARSEWIAPTDFYAWKELSWNAVTPVGTDYHFHVYYNNGGTATLIPDSVLPGNSAGFFGSPVDLSGLEGNYTQISVGISANTSDTDETPSISGWQVTYLTHSSRANFSFTLRGEDTKGTDASNNPVYKIDQIVSANASGLYSATNLPSDLYTVSKTSYEFSEICGATEASLPKIDVPRDSTVDVYLNATTTRANAILFGVKNSAGSNIPNALVRLYRASSSFNSYKKTELRCGQVFWNNVSEGTFTGGNPYTLEISAPPYTSTTTLLNVDVVAGYTYRTVTFTGTSFLAPGVSLSANPTSIILGGSLTLTWDNITDASSCTASGSWSGSKTIAGGMLVVSPAVTSTYTLLCVGPGGSRSVSTTVTVTLPPPVITSVLTATGVTGSGFSYHITGTNSPTYFSTTALPTGLSVNSANGIISGTPTVIGTTNVNISATNAGGTGNATLVITVNPPPPIITSTLTASGYIGTAFSYTITGTNSPTSFSASPLPAGLSVNTGTGAITGTPTVRGITNVTIGVTNAGGADTKTLVITVIGPLALDASSPAIEKTNATTITTDSFTPPVGSVLYIAISSAYSISSLTDNRTSHLSYTREATYGDGGFSDSVATLYTAPVTSSQLMTVSITQSHSGEAMVTVLVVTDASSANPVGAIGGGKQASGLISDTYVSTINKSWGWLIYADQNKKAVPTVGSNQTLHDSFASGYGTYALSKRNSTTPTSGTSVTLSTTAPTSNAQIAHLYFEMRPQ